MKLRNLWYVLRALIALIALVCRLIANILLCAYVTCKQKFDRELCCKQLRYSGMMETIRIRRAGYPIRHTFAEFVDRYRFLISGIEPSHKIGDCRSATARLCNAVLGKADYQLGKSKVFLKDAHDLFLEQERDRVLTKKILTVQRAIRGWYHRRRFQRLRSSAIIVQRFWRGYIQKKKYQAVSTS